MKLFGKKKEKDDGELYDPSKAADANSDTRARRLSLQMGQKNQKVRIRMTGLTLSALSSHFYPPSSCSLDPDPSHMHPSARIRPGPSQPATKKLYQKCPFT